LQFPGKAAVRNKSNCVKRLALFASGTGSNAEKIISYFKEHESIEVSLLISNKPQARALTMASEHGIPTLVIDRAAFYQSTDIVNVLEEHRIDWLILAGFLWLIPSYLVEAYQDRIINIHPALLPAYGGKGMYGIHVHRAVHEAGDEKSGITIHLVNERYDEGAVLFQADCTLEPTDSPEDIARKVQQLEHVHFARVIEETVLAASTPA